MTLQWYYGPTFLFLKLRLHVHIDYPPHLDL